MADSTALSKDSPAQVALVGNPNIGKTTLFNLLTGLRQRVGNYPGVTVSKKVGVLPLPKGTAELIDLPGTYSLAATSLDERIVVDVLSGQVPGLPKPNLVVCMIDATNVVRNLFLASQIAELEIPMIVLLNQWDLAQKQGLQIDIDLLEQRLGVPVIPCVATKKASATAVVDAIDKTLVSPKQLKPIDWPEAVTEATCTLRADMPEGVSESLSDAEIHRLLFDANSALAERLDWDDDTRRASVKKARRVVQSGGFNPMAAEPLLQYEHLNTLTESVVNRAGELPKQHSESIDRLLVHRGWGLAIFAAIMYVVFLSVYTGAGPMMDLIEWGKGSLQDWIAPMLSSTPMLQSLVVDAAIEGVGAFLVFLPQILVLFFFIALLEDTGYMARAAFLMDKMFSWCGLNGRSFVPLLSSYACAVPGIMATRTIEDPKARLATILIAPLMSCSARLPVYVLLIGAFIEPEHGPFVASLTLFAMHFLGLAVALPLVWLFNKFLLKTRPQPFVLEMPRYHVPKFADIAWRMWESGVEFVKRAGTVIFAITIIIWALLYFPHSSAVEEVTTQQFIAVQGLTLEQIQADEDQAAALGQAIDSAYLEQSWMGRMGRTVQPIFASAGFDWRITVGVLASFPAREVIISTLGVIYSLGGEVDEESHSLKDALKGATWHEGPLIGQAVFTIPVVMGIMVFFALCSQCGATLAIIKKEAGTSWAVFSFAYMTALAWLGAVLCFQIGNLLG
ncbi:ferrous iron transport protein B [Verrucomicrobiales bacterium]|nr:ferrous iron transport protein B [Verrucomicrobiales bacterium]MDB4467993.1 ferrous iron transport protein B [Verrucomicrobiales bacterium]MDC0503000.1 ferrous iron transport protein B [Verrucomicrobiales bacterium]MDF1786577.1 ferrous iron transport protein B [Verrucomicrobiales bacterium]